MEDRTADGTPTVDLGPSEPRATETTVQTATSSAFDPPGERFEAIGELGRGGMGRVDDAFDRALGRPVAIKHMLSTSEVALGRFEREARTTAVTTNVSGEPTVTDLVTGMGYALPSSAFLGVERPIGLDNMFAIVTAQNQTQTAVDLWTVDVPDDPAALRAWLSTITNAKPGPGNGSYEWP